MDLQAPDEETIIRVAVADLDDRFVSIDRSTIEEVARPLVRDLFEHARVKAYVGIIAERRARDELHRIGAEPGPTG
jgi:predicted GNAT superfamily acetyltransferase